MMSQRWWLFDKNRFIIQKFESEREEDENLYNDSNRHHDYEEEKG